MENSSFVAFDNSKVGLLFSEETDNVYPINYYNIVNGKGVSLKDNRSYFCFIYEGVLDLYHKSGNLIQLSAGFFFSSTGEKFIFPNGDYKAILIEVIHEAGEYVNTSYKAFFTLGEIEDKGRLKYIDGCTDSLLIPPVKLGDPCLNHLHFPKNIDQTQHTHPSHRIGIVSGGKGRCKTPFGDIELKQGMIFIIKKWDGISYSIGTDGGTYPDGQHAFMTYPDSVMDVIAFHPDSDFGATDTEHPMINRTIVGGVSASLLKDIQTQ